jgi:Na+-transporting methylmalonyl-CoA/oxaloacetate decarboxylase gamma subunit
MGTVRGFDGGWGPRLCPGIHFRRLGSSLDIMKKASSVIWLTGAAILSLGGVTGFILLFFPGMNVFWLILSPMIFAVYQIPAVAVFFFYKKRKKRASAEDPSSAQ